MSDRSESGPIATPQAQSQRQGRGNRQITMSGETVRIKKTIIATGDVTVTNIRRHPVVSLTVAVLAVLLPWGGYTLVGPEPAVDTSVATEEGTSGAARTVQQLRAAERLGDAEAWCELAQPSDGSCAGIMQRQFGYRSAEYRSQVDQVSIGETVAEEGGTRTALGWQGEPQYALQLVRTGGRWHLDPALYALIGLQGGAFLIVVDDHNGERQIGGLPLPSVF